MFKSDSRKSIMLKHFSVILILIHVVKKVIDESHLVIKKTPQLLSPYLAWFSLQWAINSSIIGSRSIL